mmetsp:Transcript_7340/g.8425  ORF Transcript_7340/g.8425 Transcript_7340/m.8425 type:complete len:242 (-) Transcript_7340:1156-1881(-)
MYQVRIPQGIRPGQKFRCSINGQQMEIVCPANTVPGQTIQFSVNNSSSPGVAPAQHQSYSPQSVAQSGYPHANSQSPDSIFASIDTRRTGQININQLQQAFQVAGYAKFQLKTCKLMMSMFDTDHSMMMSATEFAALFKYIKDWEKCFKQYDQNQNGSISFAELKSAVEAFGYRFSDDFFTTLFNVYDADRSRTISFDEFIQLFCELHMLTEAFKIHDTKRQGVATFKYEDFLKACLSIHT